MQILRFIKRRKWLVVALQNARGRAVMVCCGFGYARTRFDSLRLAIDSPFIRNGFAWILNEFAMYTLVYACLYTLGCAWIRIHFAWIRNVCAWVRLDSQWIRLDSNAFAWIRMDTFGYAWVRSSWECGRHVLGRLVGCQ